VSGSSRSLLHYIDAPLLVGDPDGRTVYLNPCFEGVFGVSQAEVLGQPLATLFEGGARESVLGAVAKVCGGEATVRFRLMEGGDGYTAVASPISDAGNRVGVVILLNPESGVSDRLLALGREFHAPLDELTRCLSEFADQVGGRRAERYRLLLEDAVEAVSVLRKHSDELQDLI
jgi:PAS domain S-box-containing protein